MHHVSNNVYSDVLIIECKFLAKNFNTCSNVNLITPYLYSFINQMTHITHMPILININAIFNHHPLSNSSNTITNDLTISFSFFAIRL